MVRFDQLTHRFIGVSELSVIQLRKAMEIRYLFSSIFKIREIACRK